MFKKLKRWYEQHLWTKEMLVEAVKKNLITAEEYKEITGESCPI